MTRTSLKRLINFYLINYLPAYYSINISIPFYVCTFSSFSTIELLNYLTILTEVFKVNIIGITTISTTTRTRLEEGA